MEQLTPKDELGEFNKELEMLVKNWQFEHGRNAKTSEALRTFKMRDSLSAFLEKHQGLNLDMVIGVTDDNLDALISSELKEDGDDYKLLASSYKVAEGDKNNLTVKGKNKNEADVEIAISPDALKSMKFVQK